jgi:hypothetical protein
MQLAVALCSFPGRVLGSEVRPRKYRYAMYSKSKLIRLFATPLFFQKLNIFYFLSLSPTAVTTFFQSLMKLQNGVKLLVASVLPRGTRAAPSSPTTLGSACGTHISTGNAGAKSVWDRITALFKILS